MTTTATDRKLLFSLTRKDFEVQTFCTGGPGGQHKNAKQNGVRILHPASGAVAEQRTGRDQAKNRMAAFVKLTETSKFQKWHKAEVARVLGRQEKTVDEIVEEQMAPENLKVDCS